MALEIKVGGAIEREREREERERESCKKLALLSFSARRGESVCTPHKEDEVEEEEAEEEKEEEGDLEISK